MKFTIAKQAASLLLLTAAISAHAQAAITAVPQSYPESLAERCGGSSKFVLVQGIKINSVTSMRWEGDWAGVFVGVKYRDGTRNLFHIEPNLVRSEYVTESDVSRIAQSAEASKLAQAAFLNQMPVTLCAERSQDSWGGLKLLGIAWTN